MKKNRILFKLNVFVSFTIILFGISYVLMPAKTIDKDLGSLIPHRQTSYVIKSFNKASADELKALDAPFVSVSPQSPVYKLNLIKEKLETRLGISSHNSLFYASKRLLELEKWKTELSVLESKNLINTYANLADSYINSAISDPNKDTSLRKLWIAKQKIESQSEKFNSILNKAEISKSEQLKNQELRLLLRSELDALNKKINAHIPNDQENILLYSLHPVHNEYEHGKYELSYSTIATASSDLIKINLLNSTYEAISKSETPLNQGQNIKIDNQTRYITFEISSSDITKNQEWQKNKIDQSFVYNKKISPLVSTGHAFNFRFVNNPYLVTVSRKYRSDLTPDIIFQEEIKPTLNSSYQEKLNIQDADLKMVGKRHIDIIQTSLIESDIYVEISSTTELSEDELSDINLQIFPAYNPTLILNKINHLPSTSLNLESVQKKPHYSEIVTGPISLKQSQYLANGLKPSWKVLSINKDDNQIYGLTLEYWPHWFLRYMMLVLVKTIVVINIVVWLLKQKKRIQFNYDHAILEKIGTYLYDANIFLFWINVGIYPYLALRPNIESDLVYLVVLLLGILTVVTWRLSLHIALACAILHFSFAAIFYTLGFTNISEKLAILSMLLIIIASIQSIISLLYKNHFNNGWKQLFQIILTNRYILSVKRVYSEFKK